MRGKYFYSLEAEYGFTNYDLPQFMSSKPTTSNNSVTNRVSVTLIPDCAAERLHPGYVSCVSMVLVSKHNKPQSQSHI